MSDVLLLSIYSPTYRIFDLMVVRVGNGVGGVSHGVGRVSHDGGCVVGSGHWVTDRGVSVGDGGLQGNLMKGDLNKELIRKLIPLSSSVSLLPCRC